MAKSLVAADFLQFVEKVESESRCTDKNNFHENELGLHPETQYIYDLQLPRSFEPTNTDDKVSDFYLLTTKEVSVFYLFI